MLFHFCVLPCYRSLNERLASTQKDLDAERLVSKEGHRHKTEAAQALASVAQMKIELQDALDLEQTSRLHLNGKARMISDKNKEIDRLKDLIHQLEERDKKNQTAMATVFQKLREYQKHEEPNDTVEKEASQRPYTASLLHSPRKRSEEVPLNFFEVNLNSSAGQDAAHQADRLPSPVKSLKADATPTVSF